MSLKPSLGTFTEGRAPAAIDLPRLLETPVALADDQDLVREALQALLERLGTEVVLLTVDGAELLERIKATPVDVIVADIRMPGLDGIAMVRELRRRGDQTPGRDADVLRGHRPIADSRRVRCAGFPSQRSFFRGSH